VPLTAQEAATIADLLLDTDLAVRQAAAFALASPLALDDAAVRRMVLQRVLSAIDTERDGPLRTSLVVALSAYVDVPMEVRRAIIGALRDRETSVRHRAVLSMGPWLASGLDSDEARRALLRAIRDESALVRSAAVRGLASFPASEDVVAAISDAIEDSDRTVRSSAAQVCVYVGHPAFVPALRRAFADNPDPGTRRSAAWALAELGASEVETLDLLGGALEFDPDPPWEVSMAALRLMSSPPTLVFQRLVGSIASADADELRVMRRAASSSTGSLSALACLGEALGNGNPSVRLQAAAALGELGRDFPGVLERLSGRSLDPDPRVREAVSGALLKLRDRETVPR
jgi:HEAT repeat protein